MSDLARLQFLPWLRTGAAAAIATVDSLDGTIAARASLAVDVQINAAHDVAKTLALHAPGDVTAIDPRHVVRVEPRPSTVDFEPNHFAAIDFDRPDLPWLFTPARASGDRLRPWLVLVVVQKQAGVALADGPAGLPLLTIAAPASPSRELPDLAQSWAWAHAQLAGAPVDGADLDTLMALHPEQAVSRLVCPRVLAPRTAYLACVVPAFRVGLLAGLGQAPSADDERRLDPSWTNETSVALPVYYYWQFATGDVGDFESLARRLAPAVMPPEVGTRPLDATSPGFALAGAKLLFEGVLRSPQAPTQLPTDVPQPFRDGLRSLANTAPSGDAPLLAPPIYGRWHAAQRTVPADGATPAWLRDLNIDPRARAWAGLGARVVRENAESLMTAAWQQVGDIRRANQALRAAQLARAVGAVAFERRLAPLDDDGVLRLTSAAHAQVKLGALTVAEQASRSSLPLASLSSALRRATRPRGPTARVALGAAAPAERVVRPLIAGLSAGRFAPAPAFAARGMVTQALVDAALGSASPPPTPTVARGGGALAVAAVAAPLPAAVATTLPAQLGRAAVPTAVFQQAVAGLVVAHPIAAPPRPAFALADAAAAIKSALDPARSVAAALLPRVDRGGAAPSPVDDLEPILAAPEFDQPMIETLAALSQDLLLPNLAAVPDERLTLLESNAVAIESYLVGLNHEMARLLLWRGYPTDQRGTCFRQFWNVRGRVPPPSSDADREALRDIDPLHRWPAQNLLGANLRGRPDGQLVFLARGALLRRYPDAQIYAVEAQWSSDGRRVPGDNEKHPLFLGRLLPDVVFVGFDLGLDQARGSLDRSKHPGWFFVIQEHVGQPRFGVEVGAAAPPPVGAQHAGAMALATLRIPTRVAVHADAMLVAKGTA